MSDESNKLKSILKPFIAAVKSKPNVKALVTKWIDMKYGKIIGWKIKSEKQEENYHLVITSEEAHLNVGEYPAFDVMLIGNSETILGILNGQKNINVEMKEKRLMVWGNLNEGLMFQKVLQKIKSM